MLKNTISTHLHINSSLLILIFLLLIPLLTQAKCYRIYSTSGELVYSSSASPFKFPMQPETFSDSVNKLVPGGHLIISDDITVGYTPCHYIDKITLEAKVKLKEIEEENIKALKLKTEIKNKQQKKRMS